MESNIEPPNKSNHHPCPPSSPSNLPLSFSSLPEDIVLSCLARISRSYYPKLAPVSKSFRSLLQSKMLYKVRNELKTHEECVYLCLQSPIDPCLIWYSLWLNPDRPPGYTRKSLVPVPSSYSLIPSDVICSEIGSELYKLGSKNSSYSSVVWVSNELIGQWREAPSMMVARKEALTCVRDGKIYVIGRCGADESTSEVYDPKTQTCEPLPDPGPEVRFSSNKNKKLLTMPGKIYVRTRTCVIENVCYYYEDKKCWWYDTKSNKGRIVNGLTTFNSYPRNDTEIASYRGQLVIFWDTPAWSLCDPTKDIWCAMISLHRSCNGDVWGHQKWMDIVCTVPKSCTLVSCESLST